MNFTEEHLWLLTEDGVVTVGLTEHGQELLGALVFVELPEVDSEITKDDVVAVLEGGEDARDVLAPLDGEIIEINEELLETPTLLNEDPTGRGWIFKIDADDVGELDDLLSESEYRALVA